MILFYLKPSRLFIQIFVKLHHKIQTIIIIFIILFPRAMVLLKVEEQQLEHLVLRSLSAMVLWVDCQKTWRPR